MGGTAVIGFACDQAEKEVGLDKSLLLVPAVMEW